MNEQSLLELRARVGAFFRAKGYKKNTTVFYDQTWNRLRAFMDVHRLEVYTPKIGEDFLNELHGTLKYNELTDCQKARVRHIEVLNDMLMTGEICRIKRMKPEILFEGELGRPFNDFITVQSAIKVESTIQLYKRRLNPLYLFLKCEGLTIRTMDMHLAIKYVAIIDREKSNYDRDNHIITTRVFIRFLCENNLLQDNRAEKWMSLLKLKQVRGKKIPSVYTQEEVERVINAIDRTSPHGKRDYAMVLLAARYGLRASDITGLRFTSLEWERNRIVVFQQKTGKRVALPLSEEVGSAIIEYLRYARPDIDIPFVFISAQSPYKTLSSGAISISVSRYMRMAGIDSTKRKHGTHSLRHSLASNLLKLNESLPVISEILGHTSTESTKTYLRVDIDQLRQCALDTPFVSSSFYANLYE
ncbi:MAG: tyrosine-type recombinase/integrase [Prevotella sp.]|jgi:site-specific recombinase XerD|nr:tyrosine-type recombinase/integrase [Prevotella sp.]